MIIKMKQKENDYLEGKLKLCKSHKHKKKLWNHIPFANWFSLALL